MQDQLAASPYMAPTLARPVSSYVRLHQTSGTTTGPPLRWLDTPASWDWILRCWQSIYEIVGITPNDRFFFPFSFGPFLGFWAAFEGAARRGCLVLPGGGASTIARLKFLQDNQGTILCSTPTYALRMLDVAHEEGIRLNHSSVRMLILAGEPGANIPATRKKIEEGLGGKAVSWIIGGMRLKSARWALNAMNNRAAFTCLKKSALRKCCIRKHCSQLPPVRKGNSLSRRWGGCIAPWCGSALVIE